MAKKIKVTSFEVDESGKTKKLRYPEGTAGVYITRKGVRRMTKAKRAAKPKLTARPKGSVVPRASAGIPSAKMPRDTLKSYGVDAGKPTPRVSFDRYTGIYSVYDGKSDKPVHQTYNAEDANGWKAGLMGLDPYAGTRWASKGKRKPAAELFIRPGMTMKQRKKAQKSAIFNGLGGKGTGRNSWTGGGG
jgi:hypothetical protein